jgi:hypothetical protein
MYAPFWRMLGLICLWFAVVLIYAARSEARGVPSWWKPGALCVHRHEGLWTDSGAPYYGGMQMDWTFMRAHGPRLLAQKGTADHWTPREQLRVAYRGWRVQGWGAWPRASRACGLR